MATMQDVAKAAGVASSTVSHVFRGSAPISEETKRRVLEVADQLGYRPKNKNLSKEKLRIAIFQCIQPESSSEIDPFLKEEFSGVIVASAYRYLVERNFEVWVVPYEESDVHKIDSVYLKDFSGALVVGRSMNTFVSFPDIKVPTVLAYCTTENNIYLSITPDDFRGAYDITRHLITLGHQEIAFIGGPEHLLVSKERLHGYLTALAEYKIPKEEKRMFFADWSIVGGRQALEQLAKNTSFTAVFAANDYMALGVMQQLEKMNKSIPEDVVVVGYDNRFISAYTDPPLTTVKLPLRKIATQAASELINMLEGKNCKFSSGISRIQLSSPLVVRESCGAKAQSVTTKAAL